MSEIAPQRGEEWPADMAIRVERPAQLLYLLFVRDAWGFAPLGAPALDPPPDPGRSRRPSSVSEDAALARWALDWLRALEAFEPAGQPPRAPDSETAAALRDLDDEALVAWAARRPIAFWDEGVDDEALARWRRACEPDPRLPHSRSPEHLSLPALIAAWRTGVQTVLEVPVDGYLVERLTTSTILVSTLTRSLPDLYTRALNEAARS